MKITIICYYSYYSKSHFAKIFKKQNWRESSDGPMISTRGIHRSVLGSMPDWGSKIAHPAVSSKFKEKKKKENE